MLESGLKEIEDGLGEINNNVVKVNCKDMAKKKEIEFSIKLKEKNRLKEIENELNNIEIYVSRSSHYKGIIKEKSVTLSQILLSIDFSDDKYKNGFPMKLEKLYEHYGISKNDREYYRTTIISKPMYSVLSEELKKHGLTITQEAKMEEIRENGETKQANIVYVKRISTDSDFKDNIEKNKVYIQ